MVWLASTAARWDFTYTMSACCNLRTAPRPDAPFIDSLIFPWCRIISFLKTFGVVCFAISLSPVHSQWTSPYMLRSCSHWLSNAEEQTIRVLRYSSSSAGGLAMIVAIIITVFPKPISSASRPPFGSLSPISLSFIVPAPCTWW